MKVVQISHFGGPEVLAVTDMPMSAPGPGEVVVRVRAAGVNFSETLMRQDRYAMTPPLPAVLGMEVTGIVECVGDDVGGLTEGQRVAVPLFAAGVFLGGYAELVMFSAEYVVPIPYELSFEDAAALLVQGLTALHLVRRTDPQSRTVLVNAAAGGVGSLLIQLLKRAGARRIVAGASSNEKLDFARSLGADHGLVYTRSGWTDELLETTGGAGPDVIYESVGGSITADCLSALAFDGEIVIFGALNVHDFHIGPAELGQLIFKNQSVTGFALVPLLKPETLRSDLAELFGMAAAGELKVTIGDVFSLEEAHLAHQAMERRGTVGKLILRP